MRIANGVGIRTSRVAFIVVRDPSLLVVRQICDDLRVTAGTFRFQRVFARVPGLLFPGSQLSDP